MGNIFNKSDVFVKNAMHWRFPGRRIKKRIDSGKEIVVIGHEKSVKQLWLSRSLNQEIINLFLEDKTTTKRTIVPVRLSHFVYSK